MSSEEMRVDLESFVNEGLAQGWLGWPVKARPTDEIRRPLDRPAEMRYRRTEPMSRQGPSVHFASGLAGPGMSLS
jgi:hypothetical protein